MKKFKLSSFVAGVLVAVVVMGLSVTAFAASGKTITVYPINVLVKGEVFQPKNALGENVEVFNYGGTTYAPLRALAEAYGLKVSYDAERNMAVVEDPAQISSEDFASIWRVYKIGEYVINASYTGDMTYDELVAQWKSAGADTIRSEIKKMVEDNIKDLYPDGDIDVNFYCDGRLVAKAYIDTRSEVVASLSFKI